MSEYRQVTDRMQTIQQIPEQAQPRHPRYFSLEIWRGISCLMVVFGHSLSCAINGLPSITNLPDWLINLGSWGYVGVPFFFVISGFCIAACADSVRRKSVHSSRTFFLRRFRRIYPPFWIALTFVGVTYVLVDLLSPKYFSVFKIGYALPRELSMWQWLGNLTLTEEWRHHLIGAGKRQLLGPAWSLCYEEQFYAIVGVILLVARRSFFTGAIVLTATSLALKHSLPKIGINTTGFFFDGGWLAFGGGMLVYYSMNYLPPKKSWVPYLVLAAGILYAMRGLYGIGKTVEINLVQSFSFAIVILALSRFDQQTIQLRFLKPFLWCGMMCYSLYLVHLPVTTLLSRYMYNNLSMTNSWIVLFISLPVCVGASLFVGRVFFHLVEKRFLNKPVV
jgi:peptidoglycan/LPS O-acetylase OafA/YrhL